MAWAIAALMGSACETATIVSPRVCGDERLQGIADPFLHLSERLALGEAKPARVALDLLPLGLLHQVAELGPGPRSEIGFDEASSGLHPKAESRGDRCCRFLGALHR